MFESLLNDKPILVIGRAGMDLYPDPAGTKTENAGMFQAELGGSSANIAVALTRYHVPTSLLTCVSNDSVGRFVENQLTSYGVNTQLITRVSSDARTSLAVVESRVEDHQSVIYRNNAADFQMTQEHIRAVDMSEFKALVITGTCLTLEPSRSASLLALKMAKAAGLITIMDLDYRPYSWSSSDSAQRVYQEAVDQVDVVVGNDEEFGHFAGDYSKGVEVAVRLASEGKCAVYKRGELGSTTYLEDAQIDVPVYPVTPLKPTGAGDSFMGGLLAALCRGESLERSIHLGSAAAALVVTRVGCAPAMPDLDQVVQFIAGHQLLSEKGES